jgi:membrane fusion protein (multidrug efflux system)
MKKGAKTVVIVFVIILFIAGLGGIAYYRYREKIELLAGGKLGRGRVEEVDTATPVAVYTANTGSIAESIVLNGEVVPVTEVNIFSTVPGKVKEIQVKEGQRVSRDTVLANIDRSEAGLTFAPTPVKSTIDGTVKEIMIETGGYVTPQVPLFQIIDMDTVEVVVHVPERDIYRVTKGLEAQVRIVSFPDIMFRGRVMLLSPVVDPVSRSREVRIRITNKNHVLKPGMFGECRLVIRKRNDALIIPRAAIIERNGREVVFIVEGGKAVEVEPQLDIYEGNRVSVASGLEAGTRVIVIGQQNVDNGDAVKVTEEIDEAF